MGKCLSVLCGKHPPSSHRTQKKKKTYWLHLYAVVAGDLKTFHSHHSRLCPRRIHWGTRSFDGFVLVHTVLAFEPNFKYIPVIVSDVHILFRVPKTSSSISSRAVRTDCTTVMLPQGDERNPFFISRGVYLVFLWV
jgi:hypothetical protein